MKNLKLVLLCIFALALFAGVFFAQNFASAATVAPWDISATVVSGNKSVRYKLSEQIEAKKSDSKNFAEIADRRGFYLGKRGKLNLFEQLTSQHLPREAIFNYILPGFEALMQQFSWVRVQKRDATVAFGKSGFSYSEGIDGVSVDEEALFLALIRSCGAETKLSLPLLHQTAVTANELKQNTGLKGTFSTSYVNSGANRCHNIALAAASLDGLTVPAGETFSFNAAVGRRTEQNGYKNAKVILDGAYTDGIGGGVCQVSTTLYNALLLSELSPRACQHSLVSSYVLAGFDAMVSDSGADLTFVNTTEHPIYISAKASTDKRKITFCVYGVPNLYTIMRENEEVRTPFDTIEVVDKQKYPDLIFSDQTKVVTSGSDGVKTKSFLCYYLNGKLIARKQIRQNTYKKVDKVVARGYCERSE